MQWRLWTFYFIRFSRKLSDTEIVYCQRLGEFAVKYIRLINLCSGQHHTDMFFLAVQGTFQSAEFLCGFYTPRAGHRQIHKHCVMSSTTGAPRVSFRKSMLENSERHSKGHYKEVTARGARCGSSPPGRSTLVIHCEVQVSAGVSMEALPTQIEGMVR